MAYATRTRQRRSRFTATLQRQGIGVTRKVIVAPDAASVAARYRSQGWVVLGVENGDYRTKARAQERRASGGFRIAQAALTVQIKDLGLRLPVEVKLVPDRGGHQLGAHRLRPYGGSVRFANNKVYNIDTATGVKHYITLRNTLTPDEASRTLHHELQHAVQAERVMNRLGEHAPIRDVVQSWHTAYRDGITYRDKPFEREARAAEGRHYTRPLAR